MRYREADRYRLRRIRVLLVEDEPLLLRLLGEMLERVFPALRRAGDGREGLEIARIWTPDIVVTDLKLPGLGGLEMLRRLRRRQPELPAVVISAFSERERLLEAIDTGVEKYLLKPFDPEELLGVVRRLAGREVEEALLLLPEGYRFDRRSSQLYREELRVGLSPLERRFLALLARHPGRVRDDGEIAEALWGREGAPATRIRSLVARLRAKTVPSLIETCRGRGYRLATLPEASSRH